MADPLAPHSESRASGGAERHPEYDWEAIERSPEFTTLVRKRRSFVLPATIFFLAWYFGFVILAGYAEDFMGSSVYEGLTVGYTLALTQFVMTWGLGWWYLRKADREFDPLARQAVEHVAGERAAREIGGDGRFKRDREAVRR